MTVKRGPSVSRFLFLLIVSSFLAAPAWTQEVEAVAEDEAEEVVATEETVEDQAEEFDETGLDDQGYADEDDDFRPSEDIPTDQSIAFPTDI
jgi:hypothetical protein